jgi:uncharacterized protein
MRHAERGRYDRDDIYSIPGEAFVCHLEFFVDGQPWVIPTACGRSGNQICIHGSAVNRTLHSLGAGINACVTVTLVDGFALARSAVRHSINYRSVVNPGRAGLVLYPAEKMERLRCLNTHVVPGRSGEGRPPDKTGNLKTSVPLPQLSEA